MATDSKSGNDTQRAVQLLRKMQARLETAERRQREPIAVVGIGCRFPAGADNAETFWQLLNEGIDAVGVTPVERWDADAFFDPDPATPGKMNTRWGGFIEGVDRFDPAFFNISPREAVSMDPQQRLVLETAWRALEHAGIPGNDLVDSRTGVFLGVCTSDYARLGDASGSRGALDTYSGTGGSIGVTAGRLSYTLGLCGPSLVVDTACSSSLVATHLAVNSLRNGESDLALAGGVNLVLIPDGTITLAKLRMMAPDGRCKAFDEAGDGFVRGEGCGIVVLQRLSDALAQRSRILAVISGSASNQDGRSSGLTAPSGLAQERVIRAALANSGKRPGDVAYVEAHGTGTALGDPIELDALQNALGAQREGPLLVGSVKTNIGHLEAAAGVAGLIKAIGIVRSGRVPKNLHFNRLNANVAGGAPDLRVVAESIQLDSGTPVIAGVSSFGFSGTNAHLIIEPPPSPGPTSDMPQSPEIFVVSAKSESAALQIASALANVEVACLADVAYTLVTGRSHFDYRMAVVASNSTELKDALGKAQVRQATRVRLALVAGVDANGPLSATQLAAEVTRLRNLGLCWDTVIASNETDLAVLADNTGATGIRVGAAAEHLLAMKINAVIVLGIGASAETERLLSVLEGIERWALPGADATSATDLAGLGAELFVRGARIDWQRRYRDEQRQRVDVPGHPFDRQRYWRDRDGVTAGPEHPLIGQRSDLEDGCTRFARVLRNPSATGFNQHKVGGHTVVAAAVLMEALLNVAARLGLAAVAENVVFEAPLVLDDAREIFVDCRSSGIEICSRPAGSVETIRHLSAELGDDEAIKTLVMPDNADMEVVDPGALYAWFTRGGLVHGPDYRRIIEARRTGSMASVRIAAAEAGVHLIAPGILDAALQSLGVITFDATGPMRIPASIRRVWLSRESAQGDIRVTARLDARGEQLVASLQGVDEGGRRILAIDGLQLSSRGLSEAWRGYLFERQWVLRDVAPTSAMIVEHVQEATSERINRRGLDAMADFGHRLDELAQVYARRALGLVGVDAVASRHRALYALLGEWQQRNSAQAPASLADEIALLRETYPENPGEIALLVRCGEALPEVLRGLVDPLGLIFDADDNAAIYADPPISRLLNDAAADAVLAALPADGPIRILEVGAGTAATSRAVLARLPQERMLEYRFTDLSASLVARAQAEFADLPWFEAGVLDLDQDAGAQGFDGHYDIVLAANVLHATRDLTRSLHQVRALLAAGGTLVALEGAGSQGWIDLVFGMTEGWWAFEDVALRGKHPMPERSVWLERLHAAGFDAATSRPDEAGLLSRQIVIVASSAAVSRWHVLGAERNLDRDLARHCNTTLQALTSVANAGLRDADSRDGLVVLAPTADASASGNADEFIDKVADALDLIRRVALAVRASGQPLVLVTRGAMCGDLMAAAIWGLGRAIAVEYPQLDLLSIDLDPEIAGPDAVAAIALELAAKDTEDQVRISAEGRRVARLAALKSDSSPIEIDARAIHVVTGGFGGLGLAAAERLVDLGAQRLLLIGLSAPSSDAIRAIESLRARRITVRCEIADVACSQSVGSVIDSLEDRVAGIVHCAGKLDDRPLPALDKAGFAGLLGPKAGACLTLQRHCGELDYFILYSSAIALVGASGQANHIAANAMLDAFAEQRRRAGLAAISLAFAAWSDIGSAASPGLAARLQQTGLGAISPGDGLSVLEWALTGKGPAMAAVLPLDRQLLARQGSALPPLFRGLATPVSLPRQTGPATSGPGSASAMPVQQPSARPTLEIVLREAAAVLAAAGPSAVDPRTSLFAQGLDSLMALELRNRLQKLLDRSLPSTLLFDYPEPRALASHLELARSTDEATTAPVAADRGDIAIVGMACRFPGGADTVEAFWQRLLDGYDGVRDWPADRPLRDTPNPGRAAYIDDVAAFDAALFRISPREAASMDPQQRILLETTWHALEDAGIPVERLVGSATGVYVGLCNQDYAQIATEAGGIDAWSGTGGAPSVAAGRIAFALGLEGPAMVVDTACSSSLVALHLAARALVDGDCDIALAAAANLILSASTTDALGALNMLAPDGRCKAFDASADGFGRGEGVGVIVLKRLADAERDGDHVLATVRGVAINQDGRSSSLTAPSGRAQVALMRSALARCGLKPRDIDYVEAHGTGTALGDPIEIHALKDVFCADREVSQPLWVGAVKSNVAHLEAAAGMAGVIKTVLAMNAGEIPPNVHFNALNPHVDLAGSALAFPLARTPWPMREGGTRRAGVSSFGFSGTNVHVVLEHASDNSTEPLTSGSGAQLLIVSAASAAACRQLSQTLARQLRTLEDIQFAAFANQLLSTRSQLAWRVAVVAGTRQEAAAALEQAMPIETEPAIDTINVDHETPLTDAADGFLAGASLQTDRSLCKSRVKLPLYPFSRETHWFAPAPLRSVRKHDRASHPLLGARQHMPGSERRFEAEVSAASPAWLADHQVDGRAILPAAAMLELMLAAAGDEAMELEDVRFEAMLDVSEATSLHTVLAGDSVTLDAAPSNGNEWLRIASARLGSSTVTEAGLAPVCSDSSGEERVDLDAFHAGFASQGIVYGPAFRAIRVMHCGPGSATAQLGLAKGVMNGQFRLHPVLLDGAFQSVAAAARGLQLKGRGYRPVALARLQLHSNNASGEMIARSQVRLDDNGDLVADIDLGDLQGRPVARVRGLRLQPGATPPEQRARLFDIDWTLATAVEAEASGRETVVHTVPRGSNPLTAVSDLLNRVQALIAGGGDSRLLLATEGAQVLAGDTHGADIAGAAAQGFCASLAIEHPQLSPLLIDCPPGLPCPASLWPRGAGNYAYRAGKLLARNIKAREGLTAAERFLDRPESGRLQDLRWRERDESTPGTGEIAIRVAASGLNFRDVLNVLKLYPGDAGALGGECAGHVSAIGDGVEGFELGMPVMAIAPGSHAVQVVARAELCWPIPGNWTLQQAAVAPTVYLSAAAMRDEPGFGAGCTVLIHAATGGVGMAAMAMARDAGARIFATAGSAEKRAFLLGEGAELVADSRSPDFAGEVLAATRGEGVDLVLNSLTGDLIGAGLDALKSGGSFLELGKREIWDAGKAESYRPDVSCRRIALDEEIMASPARVGQNWARLAAEIADGKLPPLPVRSFAFSQAVEAYRFMQEARHVGRIALERRVLDVDAVYMVSGGTGALGMSAAQRLAECGARHVLLVSRGSRAPDQERLQRLSRMGVEVECVQLDLSQPGAGKSLIDSLKRPLGGLVHAAGVLADGVLASMNGEQLRTVFAAKLDSAVELELASRAWPKAFFVAFSSAAGIFGGAGQANYAAANAALDALMINRRQAGFPGLSIDWGAWRMGMAAGRSGAAMSESVALAAFERLLDGEDTQVIVLPEDSGPAPAAPSAAKDMAWRNACLSATPAARRSLIRSAIIQRVADDMRLAPESIGLRRPLNDYGLDSLLAVQIRNSLSALCGETMPASLLYDHPSIAALVEFMLTRMNAACPTHAVPAPPVTQPELADQSAGEVHVEDDPAALLLQELERAGY